MNFIKNLFKDDDKIIGLCSLKKNEQKFHSYNLDAINFALHKCYNNFPGLIYQSDEVLFGTNVRNNFLLS